MCLTLSDTLKAIDLIERLKGMPAEPTCIPSAAHLLLMKSRNFTCTSEMHLQKNTEGHYWTDWYQCYGIATAFWKPSFSCLSLFASNCWKSNQLSRQEDTTRSTLSPVLNINTELYLSDCTGNLRESQVSSCLMNETFLKADKNVEPTWKKIKLLT